MILAVSTSSPMVSLTVFSEGIPVFQRTQLANKNASTLLAKWVEESFLALNVNWSSMTEIVVDSGPGSFTGVKVGVTMAKVWAHISQIPLRSVQSFDLISTTETVAVPHKSASYCVRIPQMEPTVETSLPQGTVGYGIDRQVDQLPNLLAIVDSSLGELISPTNLVPNYVATPSISSPKQPYRVAP